MLERKGKWIFGYCRYDGGFHLARRGDGGLGGQPVMRYNGFGRPSQILWGHPARKAYEVGSFGYAAPYVISPSDYIPPDELVPPTRVARLVPPAPPIESSTLGYDMALDSPSAASICYPTHGGRAPAS